MSAIVTTLDREIAREERLVGLPTNRPLTDGAIARRRLQIAVELTIAGLVAVFAVFKATGQVQILAIAVAALFGAYALDKDRHLRRLATLHGDVERISLVVANHLMHSGALGGTREILDLRDGIGRAAGRIAAGLAEVLPSDCARVRVTGPSGEVPVAAERDVVPERPVADDPSIAHESARSNTPVRRLGADGRAVLAVPMRHGKEIVGVLELVGRPNERFVPADAALVDAYGRGAIAALLAPPA